MLGLYTIAWKVLGRFKSSTENFHVRRFMDALKYGSGADFFDH